jgi:hypothetical protein
MQDLAIRGDKYRAERGKTLKDYLATQLSPQPQ